MPSSKKGDQDLSSQKASLFGKSSGSKLQKPANPYAVPATNNDPYAAGGSNPYANQARDPYARSNSSLTQPPTSSFGSLSLNSDAGSQNGSRGAPPPNRYEKSPVPPGGYGAPSRSPAPQGGYGGPPTNRYAQSPSQSGGYGAPPPRYQSTGSYGQGGGYGGDAYGNGPPKNYSRKGGYGGMGNAEDSRSIDAGRSALFGDAPTRAAQTQSSGLPQQPSTDNSYANVGEYHAIDHPGGYGGAVPDRQLTAEEQEEEDVNATKQNIRFIKQQDVASTRNARRIAEQSEQIGRDTLARLGAQGERIHNTERNLDLASSQNVIAEERARELKTLNRSMFAVHVSNPFTAQKREEAAAHLALEKNQREREIRDATQAAAYSSTARQEQQQRDLNGNPIRKPAGKNVADRARYQFEADSEDEEMENELDENLDAIHRSARTLNMLGKAMGEEINSQNRHLGRVIEKTDKVDDQIAVNRARLDRIK